MHCEILNHDLYHIMRLVYNTLPLKGYIITFLYFVLNLKVHKIVY